MKTAIALGNFDGVHIAHRSIINEIVKYSNKNGTTSIVYTFETHPRQLFSNDFSSIMQQSVKEDAIKSLGVNEVYFEKTTSEILALEPDEFVSEILIKKFNVKYVAAGFNYTFGKNGLGNSEKLKELGEKYGFIVDIIDEIRYKGLTVSSSLIRDFIINGEMEDASEFLCSLYTIRGVVTRGNSIGGELGFKTANILPPNNILLPKNGVYKTEVIIKNKTYKSITNVGVKPTFGEGKIVVETHIMEFEDDIYGEIIDVMFKRKIRDEIKFSSKKALSIQIEKDIKTIFED